jgi:hypothetical protein
MQGFKVTKKGTTHAHGMHAHAHAHAHVIHVLMTCARSCTCACACDMCNVHVHLHVCMHIHTCTCTCACCTCTCACHTCMSWTCFTPTSLHMVHTTTGHCTTRVLTLGTETSRGFATWFNFTVALIPETMGSCANAPRKVDLQSKSPVPSPGSGVSPWIKPYYTL